MKATIRASVAPTGHVHPGAEFAGAPAPEFRLTERLPPSSGYFADGDVVRLADGSYAYARYYPTDGTVGLYRLLVARDYGGGEVRRRRAPSDTRGICYGRRVQGAYGEELIGWLSSDSREIAYGRKAA